MLKSLKSKIRLKDKDLYLKKTIKMHVNFDSFLYFVVNYKITTRSFLMEQ